MESAPYREDGKAACDVCNLQLERMIRLHMECGEDDKAACRECNL